VGVDQPGRDENARGGEETADLQLANRRADHPTPRTNTRLDPETTPVEPLGRRGDPEQLRPRPAGENPHPDVADDMMRLIGNDEVKFRQRSSRRAAVCAEITSTGASWSGGDDSVRNLCLAQFIGGLQHQLSPMFDDSDPAASLRSTVDDVREYVGFAAASRQAIENRARAFDVGGSRRSTSRTW
jgi:hypothetical protein